MITTRAGLITYTLHDLPGYLLLPAAMFAAFAAAESSSSRAAESSYSASLQRRFSFSQLVGGAWGSSVGVVLWDRASLKY